MIGRKNEKRRLDVLSQSNKAELLSVIGRRRVGKTYLIREYYAEQIVFDFTGTQHSSKKNQLKKFAQKLSEYSGSKFKIAPPEDWTDAFVLLKTYLKSRAETGQKPVVFFDEVPWIAGKKSGFLEEFAYWWNDWASRQQLVVVICGSAASWMVDKVVNNTGGLHNRITEFIHLQPFTLAEVRAYLQSIHSNLTDYQILQVYMSIGGIPHYLQHIRKGESSTQIINRLCFQKDGILRNEFNNLYAALYEKHERHVAVVKALSTKWKGLSRLEIAQLTSIPNGGGLTKVLSELERSSFITEIIPFGKKKKSSVYRLIDEYSLFFLNFIDGKRPGNVDLWMQTSQETQYTIWKGYAFENICLKHVEAIKNALGISGIYTEVSSFRHKATEQGSGIQIDLLIDRADQSINLCEMKFYNDEFALTQEDAKKLRQRKTRFQEITKTKKTLFNTFVTTYGIKTNQYSLEAIDQDISMNALFLLENFD